MPRNNPARFRLDSGLSINAGFLALTQASQMNKKLTDNRNARLRRTEQMPIPRAVEIANDNADKAIEADSAGFDINRVGLQDTEGISVVEDESSTDAGKINT